MNPLGKKIPNKLNINNNNNDKMNYRLLINFLKK